MMFFVVSHSLPDVANHSFSAFCRLTHMHGVSRCWLFASGCGASFIFSLLLPDAYAQRFLSLVFRLQPWIVFHFQLFAV